MKNKTKCNSCRNGYDGTNGNGYQPCGCKVTAYQEPMPLDAPAPDVVIEHHKPSKWWKSKPDIKPNVPRPPEAPDYDGISGIDLP